MKLKPKTIKVKAMCFVVRNGKEALATMHRDTVKREDFGRLLGGHVEFGESGMEATKNSLEYVRSLLPMTLTHIHPDCGKEFLNQIVLGWSEEKNIGVSRSRSYHKNDNGYIEQRNGHIARRWFGYDRFGDSTLLKRAQGFYGKICLYHNHFVPQRLCVGTKTLPNGKQI